MGVGFQAYLASWVALLVVSTILAIRMRASVALFSPSYWAFLFAPWKIVLFLVGSIGIVAVAPFTGDPTWDHIDAAFMAVLAFTTAPWAVGAVYRAAVRRPASRGSALLAVVVWMFSASWSYDGYLLLRDGVYPVTWLWNLLVSSCLYFLAGLFWNLDWTHARGVHFAFQNLEWPVPSRVPFRRVALWVLPIAVAVALLFAAIGANVFGWLSVR